MRLEAKDNWKSRGLGKSSRDKLRLEGRGTSNHVVEERTGNKKSTSENTQYSRQRKS